MANRRSPPSSTAATRAVGYLRRSTDRQEQSIPDQKKAIEGYAQEMGFQLVDFYIDDAISGTSTLGRKAFQEMLAEAQRARRSWSAIIVYDIKRFGRIDNDEAGYYRYLLRMHGVEVHYVTESFTGDGTDDLLRPVKQWQARQESKDLSKVTIRGQLSRAEGGWWMGGAPPVGYDLRYENDRGEFLLIVRYLPDGMKRILDEQGRSMRTLGRGESMNTSRRDRALLVSGDPERVKIVQRIFRTYVDEGKGFRSISETLNEEKVPPIRNGSWAHIYTGRWSGSTVRSILTNRLYTGDMVWNRRSDARFYKINERRAVDRRQVAAGRLVPNDESDWIVVEGTHEPLVSRHLFEAARKRREERIGSRQQRGKRPVGGWNGVRSRFVLSGLLVCEACGCRFQGRTANNGKKRKDGTRSRVYYYACGGRVRSGRAVCTVREIPQADLERTVIEAVLKFYRIYDGQKGRDRLVAEVRKQMGETSVSLVETRHRLVEKQREIDDTIAKLLDNLTEANREFVDRRLAERKKDRDDIRIGLEQVDALVQVQTAVEESIREAREFLMGLEASVSLGIPGKTRTALRRCIEKIKVSESDPQLTFGIYKVPTTASECSEIHAQLPSRPCKATRGQKQ